MEFGNRLNITKSTIWMKIATKNLEFINFPTVFMKNGCGHFILKTYYLGVKRGLIINSAAQKNNYFDENCTKSTKI